MQELFLLQNQDKLFLSKQNEWVDGRDLNIIYKTTHRDEALNQLFETNTKDYGQRIHIISCPSNEKKLPDIDPDILPPPIPKAPKELIDSDNPQLDLAAADDTTKSSDDHIEKNIEDADITINHSEDLSGISVNTSDENIIEEKNTNAENF
ncbi:MAG: hypothetical protein K6L75_12685 [Cellvibrionaceae bacterium]